MKRTFLLGVVISLCFAAAMGIWAFLFTSWGDMEWKIFATTMTVTLFSLTSLGAALVFEKQVWRPAMTAAMLASGAGLLLYTFVIWVDIGYYGDLLWKTMIWLVVVAIALPHAGLLSLVRFNPGPLRVLRMASIVTVLAFGGAIALVVLAEPNEDVVFRVLGVLGILTALGTLSMPILYRVKGIEKKESVESTPMTLSIRCPRCLKQQTVPTGVSRCVQCRLRFTIDIEEPRCPKCNYLLHELTRPICPECGQALGADELAAAPGPSEPDDPR